MLLRFLGIATLSITVLTVKAMDATEVYEPPAETPTEIAYEIVYTTPVINQTAAFTHEEDEPDHTGSLNKGYMPASHETGIGRHLNTAKKQLAGYQRTPPLPVRLRSNADDVKGGIANLLGRKPAAKKQFIRHAYLPPSHKFETKVAETATDAAPANILASLETEAPAIKEKGRIAEEVEALIKPETKKKAAVKKRVKKSKHAAKPKAKRKSTRQTASQKKRYNKKKYAAAKKQRRKAARKYRFDYLAAFN